jgi:hypothetical protein
MRVAFCLKVFPAVRFYSIKRSSKSAQVGSSLINNDNGVSKSDLSRRRRTLRVGADFLNYDGAGQPGEVPA